MLSSSFRHAHIGDRGLLGLSVLQLAVEQHVAGHVRASMARLGFPDVVESQHKAKIVVEG